MRHTVDAVVVARHERTEVTRSTAKTFLRFSIHIGIREHWKLSRRLTCPDKIEKILSFWTSASAAAAKYGIRNPTANQFEEIWRAAKSLAAGNIARQIKSIEFRWRRRRRWPSILLSFIFIFVRLKRKICWRLLRCNNDRKKKRREKERKMWQTFDELLRLQNGY